MQDLLLLPTCRLLDLYLSAWLMHSTSGKGRPLAEQAAFMRSRQSWPSTTSVCKDAQVLDEAVAGGASARLTAVEHNNVLLQGIAGSR